MNKPEIPEWGTEETVGELTDGKGEDDDEQ